MKEILTVEIRMILHFKELFSDLYHAAVGYTSFICRIRQLLEDCLEC